MVLKKLLDPEDLSGAQTYYIHEATKVIIVCENKHLILVTIQIMMPYLKSFDNN